MSGEFGDEGFVFGGFFHHKVERAFEDLSGGEGRAAKAWLGVFETLVPVARAISYEEAGDSSEVYPIEETVKALPKLRDALWHLDRLVAPTLTAEVRVFLECVGPTLPAPEWSTLPGTPGTFGSRYGRVVIQVTREQHEELRNSRVWRRGLAAYVQDWVMKQPSGFGPVAGIDGWWLESEGFTVGGPTVRLVFGAKSESRIATERIEAIVAAHQAGDVDGVAALLDKWASEGQ